MRWVVAAIALWLAASALSTERELARPRDLHGASYATSTACARCHPDHAQSFARTFHRTMTQAATRTSVRAPFAGETLDYFGVRARMERREDGAFTVQYPGRTFVVDKTIGSRRVQQYVARDASGALVRLPVAFHLEEGRWFHMNGAFLTPDPEPPAVDFERHVTRWNDNCVFCHNVAPNPGRTVHEGREEFRTEVAELGIACEACHGPAREHARVNADPVRRYRLHLSGRADPTVVNPARLAPERAADVCGRCHGQRLTDDVARVLAHGEPFVPGDDLALYSAPLWRDTTLDGEEGLFAARFWPDGTPRLTAYEYQGLVMSACASRGPLTCIDCHAMHGGDPRGQLRPDRPGDALCTQCHDELATRPNRVRHARHTLRGDSPSCVNCHMPRVVYGVLDAHPTHRIETPEPARAGRPDACTNCHAERTRAWAIRERARLWGRPPRTVVADSERPELETQLVAGDPLERALAAHALAGARAVDRAHDPRRAALLLDVMAEDPYPAVRRFAARALAQLPLAAPVRDELTAFVPERPRGERLPFTRDLAARLALPALDPAWLAPLRARARDRAIDIGE